MKELFCYSDECCCDSIEEVVLWCQATDQEFPVTIDVCEGICASSRLNLPNLIQSIITEVSDDDFDEMDPDNEELSLIQNALDGWLGKHWTPGETLRFISVDAPESIH
jgi:hypothetical protein